MKKLTLTIIAAVMLFILTGCGNKDYFDTKCTFNKAIVRMPSGEVVEMNVKSWSDYEGEQIQITNTDGVTYVVSSYNCVLVSE